MTVPATTLLEMQLAFVKYLGRLIPWTFAKGWGLTLGDGYVADGRGHMVNSCHQLRLAQDLNLFLPLEAGWAWQKVDCPEWHDLGDYWKGLDPACRWGGDFKIRDYNHVSMAWLGRS